MKVEQHSKYWLDEDLFNDDGPADSGRSVDSELQRIARFAVVRRAISNFVSILSGKNLPVQFSSGKESYTDGDRVIIAAEDDPAKFDVMVGLALHEASHVLLTDFEFIRALQPHRDSYSYGVIPDRWWCGKTAAGDIAQTLLPYGLVKMLPDRCVPPADHNTTMRYTGVVSQMFQDIHGLMNILEDRRIDKYVYTNAGGYRPYYDALYNHYFFTKEVGRNLRFNPRWRDITVENYINRLLYAFHPAADPKALPGLDDMIKYMDLGTIERLAPEDSNGILAWRSAPDYDKAPALWQSACHLYMMILNVVSTAEKNQTTGTPAIKQPDKVTEQLKELLNSAPGALDALPNLDMPNVAPTPVEKDTKGKGKNKQEVEGQFNAEKAERELQAAKKVMSGEVKKKKMSRNLAASVTALEEAQGEMVDISGNGIPKAKCFVTRKLTKRLMDQEWFIFGRNSDWVSKSAAEAVTAGKRMGQILHHRLQIRNDPLMTKQTRLPHGGLDRRLLAQLGMDITSVFQKTRVDIHKPVMLHLSLDASGSMSGKKWAKVQTVATALAYLGSKIQNVDTVISIRGGSRLPIVAVVFDSRRDQFTNFTKQFVLLHPNGGTPEGLCFKATMDLVTEAAATHDTYFINFSDGEPAFYVAGNEELVGKQSSQWGGVDYAGEVAFKHTRQMVNMMRDRGVKILSYFINEYEMNPNTVNAFRKMYGEDASFVNVNKAGEVLVTLNKLLTARGT